MTMTGPIGSKTAREIFLTSSSLSFSSFSSSSCASSNDDALEINMEASPTTSCGEEDQKGTLLKVSSRGSEMSCLTHVTMQPAPSPPSKFRQGSPYDPKRIPASVFGKKTKDSNWSDESLFSLRMSNYEAFRQSNLMPEEFLSYSPSLKVKSEDEEEDEITQVMKKKKTSVVETTNNIHREKSLSPTPSAYSYPSSFAQLYQVPPSTKLADQSISLPVSEKKNKKRKKSRKIKKEKKNNKRCSICSWLFSGFAKCKCCCCCCK